MARPHKKQKSKKRAAAPPWFTERDFKKLNPRPHLHVLGFWVKPSGSAVYSLISLDRKKNGITIRWKKLRTRKILTTDIRETGWRLRTKLSQKRGLAGWEIVKVFELEARKGGATITLISSETHIYCD